MRKWDGKWAYLLGREMGEDIERRTGLGLVGYWAGPRAGWWLCADLEFGAGTYSCALGWCMSCWILG